MRVQSNESIGSMLCGIIFALAVQVSAGVDYHLDFEPPDASISSDPDYNAYFENGKTHRIESAQRWGIGKLQSTGGRNASSPQCLRIELPPYSGTNKNRREWRFDGWVPGREYWVGFSYKFAPDFPNNPETDVTIAQMKNSGTGAQIFLRIEPNPDPDAPLVLAGMFGHGSTMSSRKYTDERAPGSLPRGQWLDFVVHFKINNNHAGFCRVWVNGEKKLDYAGPLGFGDQTGTGGLKIGHYTNKGHNATRISYLDEYRRGDSFADVDPARGGSGKPTALADIHRSASDGMQAGAFRLDRLQLKAGRLLLESRGLEDSRWLDIGGRRVHTRAAGSAALGQEERK